MDDKLKGTCKRRKHHRWMHLLKALGWEYWDCLDCPAIKKVRIE